MRQLIILGVILLILFFLWCIKKAYDSIPPLPTAKPEPVSLPVLENQIEYFKQQIELAQAAYKAGVESAKINLDKYQQALEKAEALKEKTKNL